ALNSKAAQEILDLFDQIQKAGTAILLVTHDVQVAARTNRVLFMQDGRIVSELRFQKEKLDYKARAEQIMVQMRRVGI
ncbi:MAG: ABC transporter ATP-binding protein, partial [[Clostridium] scindens]|nr:ABC transporter ATP-binding protein [[Clostridium] scindens]